MIHLEQKQASKSDTQSIDPMEEFRKILKDATTPKAQPKASEQDPPKNADKPQE